jgi:pimeloyl-ACP methyl ester carboxylesterase
MEDTMTQVRWFGVPLLVVASMSSQAAHAESTPVAAARHDLPVPVIRWQPCGADFPGVQCATAAVPLDYDRPRGATTQLALARVPAGDQAHKLGTVFLNPGGPGGSGVDLVLFGFGAELAAQLQQRFDVVGFDPRGVAASDPLRCFDSEDELNAFFTDLPAFPYLPGQLRPFFDQYRSLAGACFGQGQAIIHHMSTADVARDLDLLRQAVGDERLTYLGFSYGTYLGNTYANLFPNRVRALVIDGVLDPRLWGGGLQVISDRVATAKEFDEFLRLCDQAGSACGLAGGAGAKARFNALAASILATPIDLGDGTLFTYDLLVATAASAMYSPESWGGDQGVAAFLGALADATSGNAAAAQRARAISAHLDAQLRQAAPHRADYDNGFDAYYGNQCADTEYPHTFSLFRAFNEFAKAGSIFGPFWWAGNAGCASWPTAEDRFTGPWSVRTSAPVLVVGNFFDGVTDYDGAVASSRLLRNSRLLSYAGWGHTAFGRSSCVTDHVVKYLLDRTLPAAGTVCPANPNPFLPAPGLRAANARAMPWVGELGPAAFRRRLAILGNAPASCRVIIGDEPETRRLMAFVVPSRRPRVPGTPLELA